MKNLAIMKKMFPFMGIYKVTLIISVLIAALSSVMNLWAYVCVYHVAEELISSFGNLSAMNQAYMIEEGWNAVKVIALSFSTYGLALLFSHITAFNTVARMRMELVKKLGKVPLGYFSSHSSGELRKIIEKNTDNLENMIAHQIPNTVQTVVLPIAFVIFMFGFDWKMSIICMIPIFIGFGLLMGMLSGDGMEFAKQYQKSAEDINNAAVEYVRGISVVKVFGQTADSFHRFRDAVKGYNDFLLKFALSMEKADSMYNTAIHSIFFVLIPAGILILNYGRDGKGTILSFIFFAILPPFVVTLLTRIMGNSSNEMVVEASLEAINKILQEPSLQDGVTDVKLKNYDIELKNVSFSYENSEKKVLDNISFVMKESSVTALVGESGGGKSTIANLIARFWEPQDGDIYVGGFPLKEIQYSEWMKQVSIVFQDTGLFKDSIFKNVSFFTPDATREQVQNALHQAQCDDILEKLPEGIDTVIGARGVYLSGGEMQRIALARAILKDAPIVILDEATAFADAENEYLIQKALEKLLRGKTVLLIAHRLSTVVGADQIHVIKQGKIVESGTHNQLLIREGVYADMFKEYSNSISWKIGRKDV